MRKIWRFWPLALILFCLSVPFWPSAAVEYIFSRGLFRLVHLLLGSVVSWIPFSLTEVLVIAAIPLGIFLIVLGIRALVRCRVRKSMMLRFAYRAVCVFSCVWLFYTVMHGANFYRLPTEQLLQYDTRSAQASFLYDICLDLAQKASAERENLAEDANGQMQLQTSLEDMMKQAEQGYTALQQRYPFLEGSVERVKPVQLSHWWSYTGITGMYFPFLAEANINIDAPPCFMPATAAHELAHTRGFAREDECNFWAYRTCLSHPQAQFRYSGYLMAFVHCSNAYYAYDPQGWEILYAACSDAVRRDLAGSAAYWKQFEGPVKEVSEQVNDAFLTVQGQQGGTLTYGEMVRLVIGYYRSEQIL